MAAQWAQPGQQLHQYQYPQLFQQPLQYHQNQQHQQPQYQQPQPYPQNGQYLQNSAPQYQQTPQPLSQLTTYQQAQYSPTQQFPHAQSYQQPSQQYPQAQQQHPQTQQQHSQIIQQYPQAQQQYPQAQQQAYNGYHQQYAHQQHSSQQYQSQQQAPTHYDTYNQLYQQQQQPSPANGQVPTALNQMSCFNCGASHHLAQNCPEPKREVPAGALDSRKHANPLKRAKSGGTVVTKYPPPPQNGQAQGYTQGYPPPSYGVNGQSQYQGSYNSSASTSPLTQSHEQAWQQYYQWQAYQQNQQQPQHQEASYQPQSVPASASQHRVYGNGFQQPNQAPHQAYYSHSYSSQGHHIQHPQAQSTQSSDIASTHTQYAQNPPASQAEMKGFSQRPQSTSSVSMESQSTPTSPQDTSASKDLEEYDLNSLDVPDLPWSVSQHGKSRYIQNTIVSPPASLISMPLPANFVVADALYPMPPPSIEDGGHCQSKYLRGVTSESLCDNIQASKYWKDHKEDTVFLIIPNDDIVVPINEICAQLAQRHAGGEANDDSSRQTRSQSRGAYMRKDSFNVSSQVEKLEREIAEMKAKMRKKSLAKAEQMSPPAAAVEASPIDGCTTIKEEQDTPPQSTMEDEQAKSGQDTEDLLAALGVTGSPKPVTMPTGTYNGPQDDSFHIKKECVIPQQQDICKDEFSSYSPGLGFPPPPPPPPPPLRHASWPDQSDDSPGSIGLSHVNGYAFDTNGMNNGNGYYSTGSNGEAISPYESRCENLNSRKRSHNRRDSSSDEDDAPARRQEDDVTPKLKRRQPKVAAAYSRRW